MNDTLNPEKACIWPSTESWKGLYVAINDFIPVLYLRQGRDEDAYRFIYEHTDEPLEYRNGKLRPNFEAIQGSASLGHQVLLALMAIKVLLQLKDIDKVSVGRHGKDLPQKIVVDLERCLDTDFLDSIPGSKYLNITGAASWRQNKILRMERIVMRCVYKAGCTNRHIWSYILDTKRLAARDTFGQFSSHADGRIWDVKGAAEIVAIRQYQVWMETPGSYDALSSAMAWATRVGSARGFSWPIEREPKTFNEICMIGEVP